MKLAVQHLQPFPSIQRAGLCAQPFEIPHDVRLDPFQPSPGGHKVIRLHAESQVFGTDKAVVASGNLVFQHGRKLRPDAVVFILLHGDIDGITVSRPGAVVDKGKLERQGVVKVIEKRAIAVENSGLIVC